MQEDKPPVFDASDTLKDSINIFTEMIATMTVRTDNMADAAKYGYMNATDCADYLVGKGIPFRQCHEIIGNLVLHCIGKGCAIEDLSLDELKEFSDKFEDDIYEKISVRACIEAKKSAGSTSFESVAKQLADTE
jgi:argininosuccinate lyase